VPSGQACLRVSCGWEWRGSGFVQPGKSSLILIRASFDSSETSVRLTRLIVAFDVGADIGSVRKKSVCPNTLAFGYEHIRRKTLMLLTEDHRSIASLV